jgi:hypothetical protein
LFVDGFVGYEATLIEMGSDHMTHIFNMFAEHPSGGTHFFEDLLDHFNFDNPVLVDVFWLCTRQLWEAVRSPVLQQVAIALPHPWLLRKVCASECYNRALNLPSMLHLVGTAEACQILLREGFDVNNTDHEFSITPLHCAVSFEVVECLIAAGADVTRVAIDGEFMPKVQNLRWILRLRPDAKAILLSPLLRKDVIDLILDVVCLLHDFQYPIPRGIVARVRDPELACALCSFGYLSKLPVGTKVRREWLLWRPHTHRYFDDDESRSRVWCTLLVFHRICAVLPHDLRAHLLVLAMN